jgi:hypothetical protein
VLESLSNLNVIDINIIPDTFIVRIAVFSASWLRSLLNKLLNNYVQAEAGLNRRLITVQDG